MPDSQTSACPVCGGGEVFVLAKEMNVSCGDYFEGARLFPDDAGPASLVRCSRCGFARFRDMHAWPPALFQTRIYNEDYHKCDPPFETERPEKLARWLAPICQGQRLIDYGGGNGLTAALLRDQGVEAVSYDPFYGDETLPEWRADIVTAFEVVEHVPDQGALFEAMLDLLAPGGVVLFSTLLQPGSLAPDWWYASPRNGHVSFHTRTSLAEVLSGAGATLVSLSDEIHLAAREPEALGTLRSIAPVAVSGVPAFSYTRQWDRLSR